MANGDFNAIRTNVLADNTAQAVLKALEALNASEGWVRTRWIWELLQNARDAGAKTITVEYVDDDNELIFQHDGDRFTAEEICHLIYHGSTKTDDSDTIGRYGTGFLTTHLLSNEIRVSGRLDTNEHFDFWLTRKISSVDELKRSMNASWEAFEESLSNDNSDTRTEFHYPLGNYRSSVDAVKHGIEMLKRCAPYIVIFNNFCGIDLISRSETTTFKIQDMDAASVQQFIVEETTIKDTNKDQYAGKYIVASDDIVQVTVPLESYEHCTSCRSLRDIPKLFVGFPLIHTEEFGFPAVINSLGFTPTENRDGVYLGQSDNEVNRQNERIVKRSCGLLIDLVEFAAASGWLGIHELVRVPRLVDSQWLSKNWLRDTLRTDFVDRIGCKSQTDGAQGVEWAPSGVRRPPVTMCHP